MARFGAFDTRKKKEYDLEKATPLGKRKDKEVIEVKDFEIYFSSKFDAEFVIIELKNGDLISSWSQVVVEAFNKLITPNDVRAELQKDPLKLKYERVTALKSGREYDTLSEVE